MIRSLLLLGIAVTLMAKGYNAPENRSQAKNVVKMIHLDYKTTWFNGCDYRYDTTTCMDKTIVDTSTCGVSERRQSMQWIQIVPDTFYGRGMQCMNEDICVSEFTGKAFRGKLCCRIKSVKYREMEAALYNLVPVVSAVANAQKDKAFGVVEKPTRVIGSVKIDSRYIEPPDNRKGDIARVYLYMDKQYDLQLTEEERKMFEHWHQIDPVDAEECSVAKLFKKIQNVNNTWIEEGCKAF